MQNFTGSCLCGQVKYQIEGPPLCFYHCHCQRCRKTTGTGHASNIRIDAKKISWLHGEEYIKSYKVPEAERFRNDFCGQCGSPLPRYFKEIGMVVLPAGTLDREPDILPEARIFYYSRALWSCSDKLPVYKEYVTQE